MPQVGAEEPEGDLAPASPAVDRFQVEVVEGRDEVALRVALDEYPRLLGLADPRAHVGLEAPGPDLLVAALEVEDERAQRDRDRTGGRESRRLLSKGVRAHRDPESAALGKVGQDGLEVLPADRLRRDRSPAAPTVG